MENRRLFTFLLTSMLFLGLWSLVIEPKFFPAPKRQPLPVKPAELAAEDVVNEVVAEPGVAAVEPAAIVVAAHPATSPILGSLDAASGYALQVRLTSAGAAITDVLLTSPQFKDLVDETQQTMILGATANGDRTLSTSMLAIDKQLAKFNQTLDTAHWKLISEESNDKGASAVFEYDAPDGSLRIRKTYRLPRLAVTGDELSDAFRTNPAFYTLQLGLELINLSDKERTVDYELQGPSGLLLENAEHTTKYRDIHLEFVGDAKPAYLAASSVHGFCQTLDAELGRPATRAEQRARLKEDQEWVSAFRYAGVDVQFFAALLAPVDDRPDEVRAEAKWIDRIYPVLVQADPIEPRKSDVSVRLSSVPLTLKPKGEGDTISHQYALFVGPKHSDLLDPPPLSASAVLNYGWFGPVARVMMSLLDTFHRRIGLPYFLSIICLTVLVRGCLFPLSRKQAISAARMKELQPQLAALKERFPDDKQKQAQAQMELWRKNKINPVGGCLPLFLQLPIFIGLYTALNAAVDLRLQKFLWIDNLAAPDALFRLPFDIPLLGFLGRDVSVLPICTVVLFLVQQKLFMPPAQDEQQEMQYKMMNIMTGVMGFMFWHQASGLCLYFIASSLWSIAERTLLGTGKLTPTATGVAGVEVLDADSAASSPSLKSSALKTPARSISAADTDQPVKPPGMWQKLLNAAQDAREQADRQREREQKKGKNAGRGK